MDSTLVATLHTRSNTRSMFYGPVRRCDADGVTVVIDDPYLHMHVGGSTARWNFMLPVDGQTTRAFLLSLSTRPQIPGLKRPVTPLLVRPFLGPINATLVRPLLHRARWGAAVRLAAGRGAR